MGGEDDRRDTQHGNTGRLLRGAFDAYARARIDDRMVPPMTLGNSTPNPDSPNRRWLLWLTPLAAALVVAAVVLVTTSLHGGKATAGVGSVAAGPHTSAPGTSSAPSTGSSSSPTRSAAATTVHVTSALDDGEVVGVGEPIVLSFSPAP